MNTWTKRALSLALTLVLAVSLVPAALAASAYDRPDQKLVALTFDDGPGKHSDAILDTLKAHNAKATFFMNGYKLNTYASQVRRMAAEGHQIGNHTYNHPYLTRLSDAAVRREVNSTAQLLTQLTGITGTGDTGFYLRPPYGSFNQRVANTANVPVIWCTVDSGDWKYQDTNRLIRYVGSNVQDGDIVIMHETIASTSRGLSQLLDKLEARGFEMVTVEELFWRRGITPQPGRIYYSAKNTGVNRCERSLYWDESNLDAHWAGPSIAYVKERGLMNGNQYGEFTPNFPMTRGMFAAVLGRLSGVDALPGTTGFTDVPENHYATPFIAWAEENGFMQGVGGQRFAPDRVMTRQEMAVTLSRYAWFREIYPTDVPELSYPDTADIADWAKEEVTLCSALGLLGGASDGCFHPTDMTTRAMAAVILQRVDEYPLPSLPDPDAPMEPDTPVEPDLLEAPDTPAPDLPAEDPAEPPEDPEAA